ncbi:MAG: hypothetical protein GY861_22915 [bacterium]|nr:hypothetical protein [bacterium]
MDELSSLLAVIFLAAVVLAAVPFVYLMTKWVLSQNCWKRPLDKPKVEIDKSAKSSSKPKVRIEIDPPEYQPGSDCSMEKLPSGLCQFFDRFPMQIIGSTYFFLSIMAVIISHFSMHIALLAIIGSIVAAAQPPESPPVCALEGQAYTKLTIMDKVLVALIDTGSALTLISQSILPLIGNPPMYPSPVPNAQSMSGIFPLLGVIYVDLILPANVIRK